MASEKTRNVGAITRLLRLFLYYLIVLQVLLLTSTSTLTSIRAAKYFVILFLAATALMLLSSRRWFLQALSYCMIAALAVWEMFQALHRLYGLDAFASFGALSEILLISNAATLPLLAVFAWHSLRLAKGLRDDQKNGHGS